MDSLVWAGLGWAGLARLAGYFYIKSKHLAFLEAALQWQTFPQLPTSETAVPSTGFAHLALLWTGAKQRWLLQKLPPPFSYHCYIAKFITNLFRNNQLSFASDLSVTPNRP